MCAIFFFVWYAYNERVCGSTVSRYDVSAFSSLWKNSKLCADFFFPSFVSSGHSDCGALTVAATAETVSYNVTTMLVTMFTFYTLYFVCFEMRRAESGFSGGSSSSNIVAELIRYKKIDHINMKYNTLIVTYIDDNNSSMNLWFGLALICFRFFLQYSACLRVCVSVSWICLAAFSSAHSFFKPTTHTHTLENLFAFLLFRYWTGWCAAFLRLVSTFFVQFCIRKNDIVQRGKSAFKYFVKWIINCVSVDTRCYVCLYFWIAAGSSNQNRRQICRGHAIPFTSTNRLCHWSFAEFCKYETPRE